jgi:malonyl-CoA O-methyltransferase
MAGIDRQRVKGSFHRQAAAYDDHARVQKRVVADLLEQVQAKVVNPLRVLDVGCGTGRLLAGLHRTYPQARLFGADLAFGMCLTACTALDKSGSTLVTADAEALPFADGAFDLVTSTSTFQWLTTLDHAFAEVRRVLAPGGVFLFALFGERTLFELKHAHQLALHQEESRDEDVTHGFFAPHAVEQALVGAGFACSQVASVLEVEYHHDVPALLRSLKRIGAGNATPKPARGLAGRKQMLAMMEIYEREYGSAGGIPATYEVLYGMGSCPGTASRR